MNRLPTGLKEYIYLDREGIESLYAQTVEKLELGETSALEHTVKAKVGATLRFKNLLSSLLGGELEGSGELGGAKRRTRLAKHTRTLEHRLADLIASLDRIGAPWFFRNLSEACRSAARSKKMVFVCIDDEFEAPQFYAGADGVASVNKEGYLILEKGGVADYHHGDDYYREPHLPVTLAANVTKLRRSAGGMSARGHDAILFRGYGGQRVPLSIFGTLTATPKYYQIKPYAIWR